MSVAFRSVPCQAFNRVVLVSRHIQKRIDPRVECRPHGLAFTESFCSIHRRRPTISKVEAYVAQHAKPL